MESLIVQKYGGSSLARPEQIKAIAKNVAKLHQQGHSIILVVSAMGNSTDELVRLSYEVSPSPNRRELDMLLSTGERISISLMSMALQDLGCDAISFTGSQAGVFTCGSHSDARINDIRPIRVEEELNNKRIVVLAGFQGVNPESKEITTLGRGGSDTTAVAMASHFDASACQILKDVPGIHSADPKLVNDTRHLPELSYDSLLEMCFWGAKVLHYRSVALAKQQNTPLFVGLATDPSKGTLIKNEVDMYEQGKILSINSHSEVEHIAINCESSADGYAILEKLLEDSDLPWPQVLASVFEKGDLRLMITAPKETLRTTMEIIQNSKQTRSLERSLSSVSVTCAGTPPADLSHRLLQQLKEQKIEVQKVITSPLSLSLFVEQSQREAAVQTLHNPT